MNDVSARLARHRWWLARLAGLPVQIIAFAAVVFFIVHALPGDPVLAMTGGRLTPEQLELARERLGLDRSLWAQFREFMTGVVHFDLGQSTATGRPVTEKLFEVLPATVELAVVGLAFTVLVALVLGFWLMTHPTGIVARVLRGYLGFAGALPDFVVGIVLIFVFYTTLHLVPAPIGRLDPLMSAPERVTGFPLLDCLLSGDTAALASMSAHLVLPISALVLYQAPVLVRLLSHATDDAIAAPCTLFRVSYGARRSTIWLSVYRRALPSMVSMLGTMLGTLLGGAIVLEKLFGLGGLGKFVVDAVSVADATAIRGFLVVVGAMTLIAFLLVDVTNMLLDPRRRPGAVEAES
ncbi:ABC transporter permease [Nocardia sp. NPDC058379]|uniref:ABC transporter permease n=1 Tax=unclassified Nocardia TaxID=2637762 RepID=UPI00366034CF